MSRSSVVALLTVRAALEATPIATAALVVSALGGAMLPLVPTWSAVAGLLLLATASAVAPLGTRAANALALAVVLATGTLAAVSIGAAADLATALLRTVVGLLFGGIALWRGQAMGPGLASWRATARATLAALLAFSLGSILAAAAGAAVDRAMLVAVGIVLAAVAVVGLSVARGTEELLTLDRRGTVRTRPTAAAAVVVAVAALAVATGFPLISAALAVVGAAAGPLVEQLLILLVTPFAYVAEALVRAALALLRDAHLPIIRFTPQQFVDAEAEAEYVREVSRQATLFLRWVFGLVTAAVVALLVLRALSRRRAAMTGAGDVEREAIAGGSLRELVRRALLRRESRRPPPPRGSDPAARVRRAYWGLLALAERSGARWRASIETPREHLNSLPSSPWRDARPLVAAFERARYGDRASTDDALVAEDTLRRLERALAERG